MRPNRVIIAAFGLLGLAVGFWLLREHGPFVPWLPGCTFHRLTGLHCPGCGMTRAAAALAHGDLAAAFRFNPVGMVLLPLALIGLGLEALAWIRAKPPRHRLQAGPRTAWLLVWLVIAFWILRNLPWFPFTLLAPP